ncbi:LysR family transcriptional regulator [Alkalilimnicola sp. S0819]|uniref:LysR family transcriptional regulator n=1 Tax=Alkalilimnicola sp. S0819 TaxID=2613922 RepID=UPI0012623936|nr:LysR family transcriptional regulator [Alkalilimnicola sp. S0819]KAB7627837.1 LysR family transcriptional regulator [Alkalilimnicola sp. S0819]MPQ15469.1 LysR family transcriptional regulator [Alkalilimnicola sp. S0819]
MDRIAAMQSFVQVVNQGSFSAAARQLGISKSMISKQVAGLEQHLQARLLNRSTRRLALTQAGSEYYERCQGILEEVAAAEASVSRLQLSPRGKLRLNAPLSFGLRHVAPRLSEFLHRYPELELDVDYNDRFVDLVEEGYDLAIRVSRQQDSSLHARPLARTRILLCASPEYLRRAGTPATLAELSEHSCLCYSYQPYQNHWRLTDSRGEQRQIPVSGRMRANNGGALLSAAIAGEGIILAPDFLAAEALASGELLSFMQDHRPEELVVQAVYPRTRHVPAKVRAFVDFLVEVFKEPEWTRTKAP